MRRKRTVAALLLLVVVGIALVLALRSRARDQWDGGERAVRRTEDPITAPGLQANPGTTTRARATTAAETPPDVGGSAPIDPPPMGSVFGIVRRGSEPTAATVHAQRMVDLAGAQSLSGDRHYANAVHVPNADAPVVATVSAGADGRYEIPGLSPGMYDLTVRDEGGAVALARAGLLDFGVRRRADITLPAAGLSLRGRVVRADGRPWRGLVHVYVPDADAETTSFVRLDVDGRFVAHGLRPGLVSIRVVEGPGLTVTHDGVATLPYDGELVLVVDERLLRRSCSVVAADDRTPIPDAFWITWTHRGPEHCVATGRADAAGLFEVPTLAPSGEESPSAFLRVTAPGFLPGHRSGVLPEEPMRFELVRAAGVEGQVREASTRRPVPGARVVLVHAEAGGGSVLTDADGRYAVTEYPAGEVVLLVAGGGWISAEPLRDLRGALTRGTARLAPGETRRLDLDVWRAPRLEGRVLDEGGSPVGGGYVRAEVAERQTPELWRAMLAAVDASRRARDGDEPQGPTDPADLRRSLEEGLELSVEADAEGRYRLDGLLPGVTYDVSAGTPGDRKRAPVQVVLESGERKSLDLRLLRDSDR